MLGMQARLNTLDKANRELLIAEGREPEVRQIVKRDGSRCQ
jgi:hypothetical protein